MTSVEFSWYARIGVLNCPLSRVSALYDVPVHWELSFLEKDAIVLLEAERVRLP